MFSNGEIKEVRFDDLDIIHNNDGLVPPQLAEGETIPLGLPRPLAEELSATVWTAEYE